MSRIGLTGAAEDLALTGSGGGDTVIALRDGDAPLVWTADCDLGGGWRRAPWPVADDLFEEPEPAANAVVLVAEGGADARAAIVKALGERGIEAQSADRLTREALLGAAVVVLACGSASGGASAAGAPAAGASAPGGFLPAAGMAVPASGRMLVTVGCSTAFGLLPGIDHLAARDAAEAAALVDVVRAQWDSFASTRRLGRLAAERHRGSLVYERLGVDFELDAPAL